MNNSSDWTSAGPGELNPLPYRVIATLLHSIIFICGVSGNFVLIVVVRRTRSLHKPTYCYLISLAYADLIVLLSAMPEAIIAHHIGFRWILGQFGCSLIVFGNFLGINAGSLSLLTFTFERYIAVLHPMLAAKVCTVDRANKIIISAWVLAILYCTPWLGLTVLVETEPGVKICDFRLSHDQYVSFFTVDLVLFYIVPLLVATAGYWRIAWALKSAEARRASFRRSSRRNSEHRSVSITSRKSDHSSTHAVHLLLAVTVVFAVCWPPYRGLLLYNTIVPEPWLDMWYMLFAKTLIYINSSINPFLYSFINKSLRQAVWRSFARNKSVSKQTQPTVV